MMPMNSLGVPCRAMRTLVRTAGLLLVLGLAGCGDDVAGEVKSLKAQVQRAHGNKDFSRALGLSQKGLAISREAVGDKAPDTLYFVQAVTEANLAMRNMRGAVTALRQELEMRAAAGQNEQKLQARRTLLIKLAEENGDSLTAANQAVFVSRGIAMAPSKDPQPVYQTETNYPPDQYRQGVEGDVDIAYSLDVGGGVTEARIVRATPPLVFDQAALDSFRKWRFTPMLDAKGQPVSASGFTFTLRFRMRR